MSLYKLRTVPPAVIVARVAERKAAEAQVFAVGDQIEWAQGVGADHELAVPCTVVAVRPGAARVQFAQGIRQLGGESLVWLDVAALRPRRSA